MPARYEIGLPFGTVEESAGEAVRAAPLRAKRAATLPWMAALGMFPLAPFSRMEAPRNGTSSSQHEAGSAIAFDLEGTLVDVEEAITSPCWRWLRRWASS